MGVAPVKLRLAVMTKPDQQDQPDQPVEAKDLKRFVKKVQRGDWVGKYEVRYSVRYKLIAILSCDWKPLP